MFGLIIQIVVVIGALGTNALLASKHYRKWGYVAGIINLFCWAVMETYFKQWGMLASNIIFLIIWLRGLQNNWNRE